MATRSSRVANVCDLVCGGHLSVREGTPGAQTEGAERRRVKCPFLEVSIHRDIEGGINIRRLLPGQPQ